MERGEKGSKQMIFWVSMYYGLDYFGLIKSHSHTKKGLIKDKTYKGKPLKRLKNPNYNLVIEIVISMYLKVPYFKIISWDMAINKNDIPVFIEYNSY